jgi:hypothetical protein
MAAQINDLVGTEAGFANEAACDNWIIAAGLAKRLGLWYFDTGLGKLRQWNGTTWVSMGAASSGGAMIDTLANIEAAAGTATVGLIGLPIDAPYTLECRVAGA